MSSAPSSAGRPRGSWRFPAFLFALAALLLLPGTGTLPLLDRDEPRFAGATVEMMRRGEWMVPYFNGDYRFDKPVLTYWLMRGGYALFGVNEFGARFHSVLAAVALALTVYAAGRRWFSERAGRYAAVGLLFAFQVLVHGRSAVADMPLVACVALAQWALFEILRGPPSPAAERNWGRLLGVALGVGFLAKGPIAWLVPLLGAALFRWVFWRRRWRAGWWRPVLPALLYAAVIPALWGIPALLATHGEFARQGLGEHVVARGIKAFDGRAFTPFYYPLSSLLSLAPWAACLGLAWTVARRRRTEQNAFLVAWFAAPYLIFTFYSTQLMHYVLPAYPAFLLLLGQAAADASLPEPRWGRWWRRGVLGLLGALAAALAVAALWIPAAMPYAPLRSLCAGGAGLLAALITAAGLARDPCARRAVAAAGMAGLSVAAMGASLRAVSPAVQVANLCRDLPKDTACAAWRFREPSLVFYTGRTWTFAESPKELAAWAAGPGPRLILAPRHETKIEDLLAWMVRRCPANGVEKIPGRVFDGPPADPAQPRIAIEGLNVAKGEWVRLQAVAKRP